MDLELALEAIRKLPNGKELEDALMEKVHSVNSEAKGLRERTKAAEDKARQHEERVAKKLEALKVAGLDPENDDYKSQLDTLLKGTKPASEVELLMKQISKLSERIDKSDKEKEALQQAATRAAEDAILEKARSAFSPKVSEVFGKAAPEVMELLTLKKTIAVKDNVPGIVIDDEFIPLNTTKGINAVQKIKELYPHLAITKQTQGGGGSTQTPTGAPADKVISRQEFERLDGPSRIKYMTEVGTLAAE